MATLPEEATRSFPKLTVDKFQITSDATDVYNCIAWAMGLSKGWWQPGTPYWKPLDWPADDYSLGGLERLFETIGYVDVGGNREFEAGFEKVALYGFGSHRYTHAARQLPNGNWTSKLGEQVDITHCDLECLEGPAYGYVMQIMKRPVS